MKPEGGLASLIPFSLDGEGGASLDIRHLPQCTARVCVCVDVHVCQSLPLLAECTASVYTKFNDHCDKDFKSLVKAFANGRVQLLQSIQIQMLK